MSILYKIVIETKSGNYEIPSVDLEKYREQLSPVPFGNPCLQIINEELSVLSITWDRVECVRAFPHAIGIAESSKPELLWRSDA